MPTHLTTLPPEILFHILAYTEPVCNPTLETYALYALAATNKQLNAIVEEYARNLLKRHVDIVPPKKARIFTCRKKWLAQLCQFCRKNSVRKACFYPTVTCCSDCDRKVFDKITMTHASTTYHLSKLDLFTPSPLHPHLPPLTVGTYPVSGGIAIMLSTPDVIARRDYIAGLLGDKPLLNTRPAAHERIIKHLNITYVANFEDWASLGELIRDTPKSMRTKETRRAYVKKALRKEWENMGMCNGRVVREEEDEREGGSTREDAIQLDDESEGESKGWTQGRVLLSLSEMREKAGDAGERYIELE